MKMYTLYTDVSYYRARRDQNGQWTLRSRTGTGSLEDDKEDVSFAGPVEFYRTDPLDSHSEPRVGDYLTVKTSAFRTREGGPISRIVEECVPEPEYIDITPNDEGYAAIAQTFLSNVLGDVLRNRQDASRDLLEQALTIVAYLAQHQRADLAKQVIDSVAK